MNTLKVNNTDLRNYFDIVGTVKRNSYMAGVNNSNLDYQGANLSILTTVVNDKYDIFKTVLNTDLINGEDLNVSFNSNDFKDTLATFEKNDKLRFTTDKELENKLTIESQNTTLITDAKNTYDYTPKENFKQLTEITLKALEFLNGLESIVKSIPTQEAHMESITNLSIKTYTEDGTIELAGIDGFRLSTKQIDNVIFENSENQNEQFLINKDAVNFLIKMIKKVKTQKRKDFENKIKLLFTDKFVCVYCNGFEFRTKLNKGNYFDYDSIIPEKEKEIISFNTTKENLLKELKKLKKLPCDSDKRVGKFELNDKEINLETENERSKLIIDLRSNVSSYENKEPLTIGFNPDYMIDALTGLSNKQKIRLSFVNNIYPIKIEYTDNNNNSGLNLVLPVRLH